MAKTVKVKVLVSVAGVDFAWNPGQVVAMTEEDAAKWCDGTRAEYFVDEKDARK